MPCSACTQLDGQRQDRTRYRSRQAKNSVLSRERATHGTAALPCVTISPVLRQGMPLEAARATVAKIREANPIWHKFISDALARGQSTQRSEA